MSKYLGAALLLSLCISCSSDVHPIETRPLSQKNPTSYVFPGPVPEVRGKILTAFKDYELTSDFLSPNNPHRPVTVESREDTILSKHIFANPENQDDLYLHFFREPIDASPVYFGGGKPLRYSAEFQLHLTALDDSSTQVSVITHNLVVINGYVCCGSKGWYESNDVTVEPTSIEEYKILLFIGRVLGVSDMPPLRLPESK